MTVDGVQIGTSRIVFGERKPSEEMDAVDGVIGHGVTVPEKASQKAKRWIVEEPNRGARSATDLKACLPDWISVGTLYAAANQLKKEGRLRIDGTGRVTDAKTWSLVT